MDDKNLKGLYDTLKKDGYNPPEYDTFKNDMQDNKNLQGVYNTLKKEGYTPPEYDVFRQDMFGGTQLSSMINSGSASLQVIDEYDKANLPQSELSPYVRGKGANVEIFGVPLSDYNNMSSEDQSRTYSEAIARKKQEEKNVFSNYISSQLGEIDGKLNQRREAVVPAAGSAFIPSSAVAAAQRFGNNDNKEVQDRYTALHAAKNLLDDASKVAEEAKKGDTGFFSGLGRGFKDKFMDADNWTMGLTDTAYSVLLKITVEKEERGEELSPEELKLLDAAAVNMATQAYFSSEMGRGYKAGNMSAESIPFMLEFAVNPISSTGNVLAKGLLKYGLKRFGRAAASNVSKIAGRLMGDAVAAAGMTTTSSIGRVISGANERMIGDVQATVEDGEIKYDGRENGLDAGEAYFKSGVSNFLENQSEMIFNAFGGGGKIAKEALGKFVPGFSKLSNSEIARFIGRISNNSAIKNVAKRTQFHGILGEYAEEVYNNFANIPLGEMTIEQAIDLDQNIDTFLGIAPTSVVFGAFGLGGMARDSYTSKRNLRRFKDGLSQEDKEMFDELQQYVNEGNNEIAKSFIKRTLADDKLTSEQKKERVFSVQDMEKEKVAEDVQAETTSTINAPEEIEANKVDIYRNYKRAERKVNSLVPAEIIPQLDAVTDIEQFAHDNNLNDNQVMVVEDYLSAKQPYNQYEEQTNQRREEAKVLAKEQAAVDVEKISNSETGFVSQVKHKFSEAPVYLVGGRLSFGEDGLLDRDNSSPTVYYVDENGDRQMGNSEDFDGVLNEIAIPDMIAQAEMDAENDFVASEEESLHTPEIPLPVKGEVFTINGSRYLVEGDNADNPGESVMAIKLNDEGEIDIDNGDERSVSLDEYYSLRETELWGENETVSETEDVQEKKVLDDGRLIIPLASSENEVAYNVIDRNGNTLDSGSMSLDDFNTLPSFVEEREEELNDDGTLPLSIENVVSENTQQNESIPQNEESKVLEKPVVNQTEGQIGEVGESASPKVVEETPELKKIRVIDSLPKKKDGKIDYKILTPQQQYEYTSVTEGEQTATSDLKEEISAKEMELAKMNERLTKVTGGEKAEVRDAIRERKAVLDGLNAFYIQVFPSSEVITEEENKDMPEDLRTDEDYISWIADNSEDSNEILGAYSAARELASHEQALKPWQRELLGRKIRPNSFNRFGDRNHITGGLAKAWLRKDGEDIDTLAQELSTFGGEVTEQDVVDFMVNNPGNRVSQVSQDMRNLSKRFSEIATKEMGIPVSGPESNTGKLYIRLKEANQKLNELSEQQKMDIQGALTADMDVADEQRASLHIDSLDDYVSQYDQFRNEMDEETADEAIIQDMETSDPELYHGGFTAEELDDIYSQIENNSGTERQTENSGENQPSLSGEEIERSQEPGISVVAGAENNENEREDRIAEVGETGSIGVPVGYDNSENNQENEDVVAFQEGMPVDTVPAQDTIVPQEEQPSFISPVINPGENMLDYVGRIASEKEEYDGRSVVDIDSTSVQVEEVVPKSVMGAQEESMHIEEGNRVIGDAQQTLNKIVEEREKVNQAPTEAQKEAGNYKKGHVKIGGYNISIETAKGSERSGVDVNGQLWSVTMNNDYGYIRGTESVDGDHIDMFLSDFPDQGSVFVVDQVKDDGSFDEHKVMYGFSSMDEAKEAYLANYSPGWKGLGNITEVSKEGFKKWIDSSKRKTKPFAEYKDVKVDVRNGKIAEKPASLLENSSETAVNSSDLIPSTKSKQQNGVIKKVRYELMEAKRELSVAEAKNSGYTLEEVEAKREKVKGFENTLRGLTDNISSGNDVRFRIVHHGSGTSFDKFTTEKIGTGEGNQSFGWGLYFTDKKDIAQYYAETIGSMPSHILQKDGKSADMDEQIPRIIYNFDGSVKKAISANKKVLKSLEKEGDVELASVVRETISELEKEDPKAWKLKEEGNRHLYDVEIPDTGFLHWDKPLPDEQKVQIVEQANNEGMTFSFYGDVVSAEEYFQKSKFDGFQTYKMLSKLLGGDKEASGFLNRAGFNGMEYITDRHSGKESVDSNFVVFDENAVKIINHLRYREQEHSIAEDENVSERIVSSVNALSETLHTTVRVARTIDDVPDGAARHAIEEGKHVKGWYDTNSGEVVVYLPNTVSIDDAQATMLHEVVAHKGLRDMLGKDAFDELCGTVFDVLPENVRDGLIEEHGDRLIAGDEYMASIAEKGIEPSLWEKIKSFVREAFRKIGADLSINDNDIKYLLWKSKNRLINRDNGMDLVNKVAADAEIKQKLGVSEYGPAQENNSLDKETVEKTIERFDSQVANHPAIHSLCSEEDVEGLSAYGIKNVVISELKVAIKNKNIKAAYLPNSNKIVVFPSHFKSENDLESFLWHENTHYILQNSGIENKDRLLDSCLAYVKDEYPDVYSHITDAYKGEQDVWAEESAAYFMQHLFKEYGAERLLSSKFGGDSNIANLVTHIIAKTKDGSRKEEHNQSGRISKGFEPEGVDGRRKTDLSSYSATKNEVEEDRERRGGEAGIGGSRGKEGNERYGRKRVLGNEHEERSKSEGPPQQGNDQEPKDLGEGEGAESGRGEFGQEPEIIRFRDTTDNEPSDGSIEQYEAELKKKAFKAKEAYQDSMLAFKKLQDVIVQKTGQELKSFENAYTAENHLSSKNTAEIESYGKHFFRPIMERIGDLINNGNSYDDVKRYAFAKHGLERNEVFARRDARNAVIEKFWKKKNVVQRKYDEGKLSEDEYKKELQELQLAEKDFYEQQYEENRQRDYSGLTTLTEDKENYEELAQDVIDEFEQRNDVSGLWQAINSATKETLKKTYESGLINKATYEKVNGQFLYYIPLRGWNEETAADVYEYLQSEVSPVNATMKTAKGRMSLADDPFATIGNMAESNIFIGNRNLMKQRFMNMVLNHPSDVVSLSEAWYVKDSSTGDWVLSTPDIKENDTSDEVRHKIEEHENRMQELVRDGDATKVKEGLNINYRISDRQAREHMVVVKRNGKEYVMYVNGNPRAAQAINGITNPDANEHPVWKWIGNLNRQLASNFTTRNPAFVVTNLSRDLIYSISSTYAKEGTSYGNQFIANIPKAMKVVIKNLRGKGGNSIADVYFKEYLANGGETGYANLMDVKAYKKFVENEIGKITGKKDYFKYLKACASFFSLMNRWAENVSRFNAYMTSREMGRDVFNSVSEAKEVTVNFNKKGAGYKTKGFFGLTSGTFKELFLFFNAAVQSLNNFSKIAVEHKSGFVKMVGGFTAAGFMIPALNALVVSMFGDGEDDYYSNLPEWVRRNNVCIYTGYGKFLTIPLPIELRAFYGLGEMAYQEIINNGHRGKRIAYDAINQITDLLPINPLGNNGDIVSSFTPDIAKPVVQMLRNKDYTGKPIYKENSFNEYMPEWTKTYNGTSKWLKNFSEWANDITGGNKYKRGGVNFNPAKVEHLFESYFGGMAKTINQASNTLVAGVESAFDGERSEDLLWRNAPVLNRFINDGGDDRTSFSKVNSRYYNLYDTYKDVQREFNGYKKEISSGNLDYLEELSELQNSKEFEIYMVFEKYRKTMDRLNKLEKSFSENSKIKRKEIEIKMMDIKKKIVTSIDEN